MNGYNFTHTVRRSLAAAREEAARLGVGYVDCDLVLLGLLRTPKTVATAVLQALSVDPQQIATTVEKMHERGETKGSPDLPYTSRAKKILELAMISARERSHSYVGTEHVLLGIIREEKSIAAQALVAAGTTVEAVDRVLPDILAGARDRESLASAAFLADEENRPAPTVPASRPGAGELSAVGGFAATAYACSTSSGPLILLALGLAALIWSRVGAYDPHTWLLEVFPIFLAVPVLVLTRRRFPLTPLVYLLIFVHALILMVGGHYTYARVPLGFWIQDAFHLSRNPYDRIGHLAQGFVPAIIAREILIRNNVLRPGKWLIFLVTCVCLSISACYEFVEWFAAVLGGSSADAFLGTQGDVWDTQWDMLMALIGALAAQLLLSRFHDRLLKLMRGLQPPPR
jgi:putative membrane protein